jgi:hypothetical protein
MQEAVKIPELVTIELKAKTVELFFNLLQEAPFKIAQPVIEELMIQLKKVEVVNKQ